MAEELAPAVVAVIVASDPGPWLEECLAAFGAQDYPRLSTLVVDAGSIEPLAPRIAAVAPEVYVRRLTANEGFGPSANVVLDTVEGSAYYLFCHDDVAPDADAVRKMVEEAYRSNAGLVAPKLVAFDEPDRLLQLGLGVDRFGAPVRRVARGEVDQSQHDEAREVFGAPGGCTLVRCDLFEALGGYDEKISMFGEDVDLSWRARIAGARVVVAPTARVRHCEATASRQRPLPEARALQWRHELRAVLKNYGRLRRLTVGAQLAAFSIAEIVYFGIIGKRWRVRQVVGAWTWNLASEQELRLARHAVGATRRIPDRVVAKLFTRRSLRVTRFVRPWLEEIVMRWAPPSKTFAGATGAAAVGAGTTARPKRDHRAHRIHAESAEHGERRTHAQLAHGGLVATAELGPGEFGPGQLDQAHLGPGERSRSRSEGVETAEGPAEMGTAANAQGMSRRVALGLLVAAVICIFGSRTLLSGHLPLLGEYLPLPSPSVLIGHYLGGWTDGGLQRPGPSTPAWLMLGLVGFVLGGAMGVVLKLTIIAGVVLGALGVARLLRPLGPPSARVAGASAYLFLPLAWNDLAAGNLQALAVYAGMPWLIARIVRATELAPFARAPFVNGAAGGEIDRVIGHRPTWRESIGLGAILAVTAAFAPLAVVLVLACAVALAMVVALLDEPRAAARALVVTFGAVVVAFILDFPWSLTFVQPGARWSILAGAATRPNATPRLSSLFDLTIGPIGHGILAWGLIAGAGFVLLVGRGFRFAWGARLWIVLFGALALAWSASEGWLGAGGGDLNDLVAPVAVCIAVLVGLGVATAGADLRRSGFGWRHAAGVLFGLVSLAGMLPVLVSSVGGRWELPTTGFDTVLSWMSGSTMSTQKSLWLGDPRALPLTSWQIAPGLAGAISDGGLPDAERIWPASNPGLASAVLDNVKSAESGLTITLGRSLATRGIRYVIVPTAAAPELPGTQQTPYLRPPQVLMDALGAQSDLHELPTEGGVVVFENSDWRRGITGGAVVSSAGGTPAPLRTLGVIGALVAWAAIGADRFRRRRSHRVIARRGELHGSHLRTHGEPTHARHSGNPSGGRSGRRAGRTRAGRKGRASNAFSAPGDPSAPSTSPPGSSSGSALPSGSASEPAPRTEPELSQSDRDPAGAAP